MASFRKRGDKWQARVHRKDHSPVVKSFNTKADAVKWARHTESQLDLGTLAPKKAMPPLTRIVDRYLAEVTPTKKGAEQELNQGRASAGSSRRDHSKVFAFRHHCRSSPVASLYDFWT